MKIIARQNMQQSARFICGHIWCKVKQFHIKSHEANADFAINKKPWIPQQTVEQQGIGEALRPSKGRTTCLIKYEPVVPKPCWAVNLHQPMQ